MARSVPTVDGDAVEFEALWKRRAGVELAGVEVQLPSLDDLIATKRIRPRPQDLEDIRLLRILKESRS